VRHDRVIVEQVARGGVELDRVDQPAIAEVDRELRIGREHVVEQLAAGLLAHRAT
jgi:hypothetical protein